MHTPRISAAPPSAIVALATVMACLALLAATPFGIGVTPDSVAYLEAAKHFAQGLGMVLAGADGTLRPLTHWPPLYPATLAWAGALAHDPLVAARAVALAFCAANVIAVALATFVVTRSGAACAWAAILMAASVDMLFVNTTALSDSQFVFFTLACLTALTAHASSDRYSHLVLAASCAGLAWLGRYVGVTVVVAGGLSMLVFAPGSARARVGKALGFVGIACGAPLLWSLRNARVAGAATDRELSINPEWFGHMGALLDTVGSWLLPGANRLSLAVVGVALKLSALALLALLGFALLRWARPTITTRADFARSPLAFLVFAASYVGSLIVAVGLFDHGIPLDNRILAPAFPPLLISAVYAARLAWQATDAPWFRRGVLGVATGVLALHLAVGAAVTVHFRREGRGFVGPRWRYAALASALAQHETDVVLSNYPSAVDFRLGRRARELSRKQLVRALSHQDAVDVVFFEDARSFAPQHNLAAKSQASAASARDELFRGFDVTLTARERNAALYRVGRGHAEGGVQPGRPRVVAE